MKKRILFLLSASLWLSGCEKAPPQSPAEDGLRIISMAPNITEILYALGLSNNVVGVSRYSTYPPEAAEKPVVGALYDPNWEKIVSLQADLVIGLKTQKETEAQLQALDIDFVGVSHEHIRDILQSILTLGKICGAENEAQRLLQTLKKETEWLTVPPETRKPRVLVCIGHDATLSRMYIAGKHTFYDELLTLAGGTNACGQTRIPYPEISPEGLRAIDPDLILDLLPPQETFSPEIWGEQSVITLTNDYSFIPGPRFVLLLEDFVKAIHE